MEKSKISTQGGSLPVPALPAGRRQAGASGGKDQKVKLGETASVSGKREARAVGRGLHLAPTKVRDLMRLIRGKTASEAETILKFSAKLGGESALKVLRSAEANAGSGFDKESWIVDAARADKGPIYRRRVLPRARGSRDILRSPSTHLLIVIKEAKNGTQT